VHLVGFYYTNVIVFLFSPPWKWPHEWPKHFGGFYCSDYGGCDPTDVTNFV